MSLCLNVAYTTRDLDSVQRRATEHKPMFNVTLACLRPGWISRILSTAKRSVASDGYGIVTSESIFFSITEA